MLSSRRTALIRFAVLPFVLSIGSGVYAKPTQEESIKVEMAEKLNEKHASADKKSKKPSRGKADGVSSASQRRAARKARREKQQEK